MRKSTLSAILLATTLLFSPLYPIYALDLATPKIATDSSASGVNRPGGDRVNRLGDRNALIVNKIDDLKAKLASKEAEFKSKLSKFKDQEKAAIVQRINDNLNVINKRHTDVFNHQLDIMSQLLDRLEKKSSTSVSASSSAQLTITQARTAILNAKNAVASQSAKTYMITITSETKVHTDAMTQRDLLSKDLKSVRGLVVTARDSVVSVIKSVLGVPEGAK